MILSKFLEACLDNEIEIVLALLAEDVRLVDSLSEAGRYSALPSALRPDHQDLLERLMLLTETSIKLEDWHLDTGQ